MSEGRQLDLFSGGGSLAAPPAETLADWVALAPGGLTDAALIRLLPQAGLRDAPMLAAEAARRRLDDAVPALAELCRRFRGFGLSALVAEQVAALRALAAIGGPAAASSVAGLLDDGVVQGPGFAVGLQVAAQLGSRLAVATVLLGLQHADPTVRADACRLARPGGAVVPALFDLMQDLHVPVAEAAACTLAGLGYAEARPILLRCLARQPSAASVAAFGVIADDDGLVVLGRLAASHADLADSVLAAL